MIVDTTLGPVRGVTDTDIATFKGIPYAAPPVGPLRFQAPQPHERWTDVRAATAYGPSAPQKGVQVGDGDVAKALVEVVGASLEEKVQSENCLVLNVWAPAAAEVGSRPVMVWIHGGGFANSSGSIDMTDGTNLARRGDVVVVSLNHRLGALGYVYLAGLDASSFPDSGNAGMLDLVAALTWVRDNIANFGGDPGNVTIFGESGGGQKISHLLAMPSAQGLFHKAIIQSGPALQARTPEAATATAQALLDALGIGPHEIATIEDVPVERIVAAQAQLESGGLDAINGHRFTPVVDGRSLPQHPFEPSAGPTAAGIPLMIGTTKDEITLYTAVMPGFAELAEAPAKMMIGMIVGDRADDLYALYTRNRPGLSPAEVTTAVLSDFPRVGSIRLAERKVAAGAAPVFMYMFNYETEVLGGVLKATHGLDIPFIFHNVDCSALTGARPARYDVADAMADTWIAFATTGNPSAKGLPEWHPYALDTRTTMLFDAITTVADDPHGPERAAWEGIDLPI